MTPTERKLNQDFRKLAQAGPLEAPAHIEENLVAAFRNRQSRRAVVRWSAVAGLVAAVAAGMIITAVLHIYPGVPADARLAPSLAIAQETADFVPLPGADTDAPLAYATIVRVQLPRYALRDIGFPVNEQSAADRVQADVLLGHDGLARAVRFVQ